MIDPEILESLRLTAEANKASAEACLDLIRILQQAEQDNKWIPLNEAADRLGSGISAEMLKDRCTDGRFKHGKHFINTSDGKKGNYLIKVSAVRQYLETDPSRRPLRRAS